MDDEQRTERLMLLLAGTEARIDGPYSVSAARMTDAHLLELADWADLESLYLHMCPLTDRSLDAICRFRRLKSLEIGGTGITSAGIAHAELPLSLFYLGLSRIYLTDEAVNHIVLLPRLKLLNCNGCSLSLNRIARLVVMPELELLEALDCQLADRVAQEVSRLNPAVNIALTSGRWKDGGVRRYPPNARLPKF